MSMTAMSIVTIYFSYFTAVNWRVFHVTFQFLSAFGSDDLKKKLVTLEHSFHKLVVVNDAIPGGSGSAPRIL